jgi:hypothetical protein
MGGGWLVDRTGDECGDKLSSADDVPFQMVANSSRKINMDDITRRLSKCGCGVTGCDEDDDGPWSEHPSIEH